MTRAEYKTISPEDVSRAGAAIYKALEGERREVAIASLLASAVVMMYPEVSPDQLVNTVQQLSEIMTMVLEKPGRVN